jgi:hypothetical protein
LYVKKITHDAVGDAGSGYGTCTVLDITDFRWLVESCCREIALENRVGTRELVNDSDKGGQVEDKKNTDGY